MRDALGTGTMLGYCTNVHAGRTWDETRASLERHAVAVRERVAGEALLGIGLWLSDAASREVDDAAGVRRVREALDAMHLEVFTINGFPFHDFHEAIVKHRVYTPTWAEPERASYTLRLARLLAELIPREADASISTVPVAWPGDDDAQVLDAAAEHLAETCEHLARLRDVTSRRIHVDLEPEPGCLLDTSQDVVDFVERYLRPRLHDDLIGAHFGVCHDVCHAAVMYESQHDAIHRYLDANIPIGKVQLSSALRHIVDDMVSRRPLEAFAEPRYLHQTVVRAPNLDDMLHDDLDDALMHASPGEWRVHFHVPLHCERIGDVGTTQAAIVEALRCQQRQPFTNTFEIETYAWTVLPDDEIPAELADGIARELRWVRSIWEELQHS